MPSSKDELLRGFLERNPNFDLPNFDLNRPGASDRLDFGGRDRAETIEVLKTFQRLLRLHPSRDVAAALAGAGFSSAHQVAALSERRFTRDYAGLLEGLDGGGDGGGARLAQTIHRNARAVQTGARLLSLDAQMASQVVSVPPLTHLQGLIPFEEGAPSYERLFGRNVHAVEEDAQTIFSPSAYFVDLMNLIDEYITRANAGSIPRGLTLQERRPDLWQIKLDSDSTYTELPYVEIVNQILESKLGYDLGEDPREYIANAVYPFTLPANLPLEEVRAYLAPFKLTLAEIYGAYRAPKQQTARESLGLSLEGYGLISGSPSPLPDGKTTPTVADAYGLYESQTTDELSYQQFFLEKTGLTSQQLDDLINQNTRRGRVLTYVLSFDGSDDYGECSSNPSLEITGDQTIEMWLNASALGQPCMFWKAFSGEFGIYSANSQVVYTCGNTGTNGGAADVYQTFTMGPITVGQWFHLAIVRDWKAKQVRGYFNGVMYGGPKNITLDEIVAGDQPVFFAKGSYGKFNGQMAEVRLWNVARSQEEIRADMNRRLTGREPGLAGYWPMDEGSGSTLRDLTPNNNTATLYGNPTWTRVTDPFVQGNELDGALLHGLFINSALPANSNYYLSLAEPGRIQVTDGGSEPSNPNDATLDLLQRFIRLAAQLGWDYADLDWTLRSLGAGAIDDAALSDIALVRELQAQLQQPLDVLCSLWFDMKTIGLGAQAGPPQDLFDRVFNLPDAFYSPDGRRPSPPYHPSYSGNPLYQGSVQSWHVDSAGSDAADAQFRTRLMAALQLNDGDLTTLAHYLCDQGGQGLLSTADLNGAAQDAAGHVIALTVQNLSLLYRYSRLAQLLKLSLGDFLTLLPLVGQPAIEGVKDVLKVCGWARWLKEAGLSAPQLSYITTGVPPRPVNQDAAKQAAAGMMNALAASSQSVLVTPAALMTGGMNQSQAQKLFDHLVAQGFINAGGLVLHERPLSPESVAAPVRTLIDEMSADVSPQHEPGPVMPPQHESHQVPRPSAQDVEGSVVTHVSEVLRAYLARQNGLVVKTLANGLRATPAQVESAALLTEMMRPTCLTFDGTDDYSEVAYSSALNPPQFTISCWVKVAAQTTTYQSVVTSRNGTTLDGYIIYVKPSNYSPPAGFDLWVGNGKKWQYLTDYTPITDEWTHVAVTYGGGVTSDGGASYQGGESILYLNGEQSSGPDSYDYVPNTKYPLRIGTGCTEGPPYLFFGGEISDLRLWNTVLSAEQIQAEMYSREPRHRESLAAWWPIRAGSGTTLYDWSLNGHDGPLYEYADSTTTPLGAPDWHNYHLNQLLNPLESGAEPPPDVLELLELTAQNLTLVKALNLTPAEVAGLVENPAPFGIEGIGFSFTPEQVRAVWEFKRLCKAFNVTSDRLLAYFADPSAAALAQVTGWDEGQIVTLESYLGGLGEEALKDFDTVAGVAALKRCFDVSLTLGVSVDYVLNTLLPLSDLPVLATDADNWTLYENAAASVKQVLQKHYRPDLLKAALASIRGPLQERLRDRLSRLLIWELGETFSGIRTEQDLYEFLLTDVETSSVVQLSYLKEGLNALQLYVQRCMTNLESGVTNTIPREWWAWMDSYRVWQANREVFLYPENYVDPTLRKLQSPQFRDFSTQLMQGQLTEKLVSGAYADYMDALEEMVSLRVVESYAVERPDGRKLLHLFGCTRTEPPTFYLRTALINEVDGSIPLWSPWEQLNFGIKAEHVTPVYAFGRLFLFWVEQNQQTVNQDPLDSSSDTMTVTTASIKYCFRKMGRGWVQPQTLRDNIVIGLDPTTSYQQATCPAISFDPDSPSWQKVVALVIPASGDRQDEELVITCGPLVKDYPVAPYEPLRTDSPFIDSFNRMIYRALQTSAENPGRYAPLGPTTMLSGNLARRSTRLAISSGSETWTGHVPPAKGGARRLQYVKLDLLRSLFGVEEFPPGLVNYWPLGDAAPSSYVVDAVGAQTIELPTSNGKNSLNWRVAANPFSPSRALLRFGQTTLRAPKHLGDGSVGFPDGYSEITIEAWVNLANAGNNQKIIAITDGSSQNGYTFGVGNNGSGVASIYFEILNLGIHLQSGNVDSNQWTHLAFTARASDSSVTAYGYVNGVRMDSHTASGSLPYTDSVTGLNTITIGSAWNEWYVEGYVSEVRLWDVQLSDEQIFNLWRMPAHGLSLSSTIPRLGVEQSVDLLTASVSPLATARPVGNQPGWFIFDNTDEVFLVTPLQAGLPTTHELASFDTSTPGLVKVSFADSDPIQATGLKLNFTRLSTQGFRTLSRLLLSGGVRALLSLPAQRAPELVFNRFEPNSAVVPLKTAPPPTIDFAGAYGDYYWEIFFHMPLLVGNGLNARQQFAAAKKWYEFIFDPTEAPPAGPARQPTARLRAGTLAVRPRGLVSYWPLDGSLSDEAGGNDLTSASIAWVQATLPYGETRQVLSLDGSAYAYRNNNPTLQVTGDQTLELWLMPTDTSFSNPLSKCYIGEGDLRLSISDQPALEYRYGSHGQQATSSGVTEGTNYWSFTISTAAADLAVNKWVHVVVVRDVTRGQIRGYVNGQEVFTQAVNFVTQPVAASTDLFSIGNGYNGHFKGQVADVALWAVARTPGEIAESYKGGLRFSRNRFWRFVPFRRLRRQPLYQNLSDPAQILIYEYDPFDPDALAHQRTGAYEKAVVQRYVNNLINYGDYLFTQDTWETLTEAQMYYVLAGDLLGRPPKVVVSGQGQAAATYPQLAAADAEASPFVVDLETQVDGTGVAADVPGQMQELLNNWRTLYDSYFKVPANSQLFSYYKTIADRLYKIRNGLNIEGQPVQPPLYEPPIDPETLVTGGARGWAGDGGSPSVAAAAAVPAYRFDTLIQQAKGLASEAASLGASLLAALEKQDAEQLALIQATQQNTIFNLTTQLKQSQISQLQAVNESLAAGLAAAQLQQSTYQQWLAGGLSAYEVAAETLIAESMFLEVVASSLEGLASLAFLTLPDNFQEADKAGNSLKALSAVSALMAKITEQTSQIIGMQGQFDRRSQEWTLQAQLAANSVSEINAQLQANQYELDAAQQDLVINQTSIEQSQQVVDFLSTKFTNQELYQWMAGQLSTLYYQAYQLACQVALQAQTAYQYEMCSSDTFINTNAWNGQYRGLLAGESLLSNLDQMEQAYLNNNTRKLEITKTVSLLRLDPLALLALKRTGRCKFTLDELLFDLDYPGHYQRTIQTVSLSIPAVVGPYQNVHATLTQLSNATVTTPNLEGVKYLLGLTNAANGSVRMNWNPSQEVALSSGIDDSGLFQLNFNDERYLPFEGTGAVSEWRLSMPKASNPFNFESISDVIISVKYSAYDGGQTFAKSILDLSDWKDFYPLKDYKGYKYLSLRQVYGNAWHAFLDGDDGTHTLNFALAAEMFPVNLTGIKLGRGDGEQVILAPVFAPSVADEISGDVLAITLNDNPWSHGLVDATSQPSGTADEEAGDTFPLKWSIRATIATSSPPSPLLLPDGRINPALWQDIVLIIPYSGTLDWGMSGPAGSAAGNGSGRKGT